ncbi:MAG: glycosyltransferase family 2 protein [bacterium]
MARLSLCMIVRNEQAMLPGFLASVDGLWDELVAVDTGSDDRTAAILADAGARVIPFAWRDDFAAARNAGLAEATGDWILFLDADERPGKQLAGQIRDLLDDDRAGAATVVMRNEWPDGQVQEADLLRVFRNDPGIRFRHRIHEDPGDGVRDYLERTGRRLRRLTGVVRHLGYVREVAAARNKQERDMRLLEAAVRDDPDDLYSWFKLLEQARFWNDQGTWKQAALKASWALDRVRSEVLRERHWSGELAALIAQGLLAEPAAALNWLDARAGLVRPTGAWHLRRGMWLEELGRLDEAALAYRACLATGEVENTTPGVRPVMGMCRIAAGKGDLQSAAALAHEAAALGPRDPEALLAVAVFTPQADLPGFVGPHLERNPDALEPLARALIGAGRIEAAFDLLARGAAADSGAALGLLTCALALGRDVEMNIDLDQETADKALRAWVALLWQSRRQDAMAAFTANAAAVAETFPWLPSLIEDLGKK